jgi:hypothetical protein
VVSFTTPEQVTNPPSPTGPLTASFSVSGYTGSFTPVPVLHYGINFSLDPSTRIFCAGGVGVENCTVKIYFYPTLPGALKDALFLMNPNTGTRMASVLLGGIGLKSLALIQPGVVTNAVPNGTFHTFFTPPWTTKAWSTLPSTTLLPRPLMYGACRAE